MGRVVAFHQLDTLGLQLGAHGWVDVGIGAADLMPEIPRQQCQRAHERTADTENVQMHRAALLNKDSRADTNMGRKSDIRLTANHAKRPAFGYHARHSFPIESVGSMQPLR